LLNRFFFSKKKKKKEKKGGQLSYNEYKIIQKKSNKKEIGQKPIIDLGKKAKKRAAQFLKQAKMLAPLNVETTIRRNPLKKRHYFPIRSQRRRRMNSGYKKFPQQDKAMVGQGE
jgi:hypothetical protein